MQLLEGSQRLSGERTKVTNQSESDGFLADKQGQVLRAGQRDNDALPISRESIEFHICHSTLARLVNSKIMTPSLGPDFHKRLIARLFLSIRDGVLRVFDGLAIQLGYHIPSSQPGSIRRRIRRHVSDDSALDILGNVQLRPGVLIEISDCDTSTSRTSHSPLLGGQSIFRFPSRRWSETPR